MMANEVDHHNKKAINVVAVVAQINHSSIGVYANRSFGVVCFCQDRQYADDEANDPNVHAFVTLLGIRIRRRCSGFVNSFRFIII